MNETELGYLTGTELRDSDTPERFSEAARTLGQGRIVCVTLGKRGVLALVDNQPLLVPGREVKAVDTTGAGDCFVGALASQLAIGKPLGDALAYANAAASICVQRMGAAPSMPTAQEVEDALSPRRPGEGRDP
ncbi:sugar/nucleoside kinase (ribokinase family) [Bradyrhizobium elkanii]|nr:ribokinase [Bradyrhizobium elkanii]